MADLLATLHIDKPIVLAPMGGGPGTPELAAAVSNAGGLGSLAFAYVAPAQIAEIVARTRALTRRPLNMNLFAGGHHAQLDRDPGPILEVMAGIHAELQLPPPSPPEGAGDPFPAQAEAVLAARPEVFSFTFGIPPAETLRAFRAEGIVLLGTATTAEEAEMLADAGVDAVVAQGAEAGAHRGTFAAPFESAMVPALDLVRQIKARVAIPVIASGGLMDGRDIAAALDAGASAVQLGTAFLLCPEAGTSAPYRAAVRAGRGDDTVITRAFSGRPARGLRNRFIETVGERDELILPFPIQNTLTRSMRTAAAKANRSEYLSLWVGTGVARARELPAGELVDVLMREVHKKP